MKRNMFICATCDRRCDIRNTDITECCHNKLLHEMYPNLILPAAAQNRRTGKTTTSINRANFLAKAGFPVIYVADNCQLIDRIRTALRPNSAIKFVSFKQIMSASSPIRGLPYSLIIIDDISFTQLEKAEPHLLPCGRIVSWLYTPPRKTGNVIPADVHWSIFSGL